MEPLIIVEQPEISEPDPLLDGGYRIGFVHALYVEIHPLTGEAYRDVLTIRILLKSGTETYSDLIIELSTDADLFKCYTCHINSVKFELMKKQQRLTFNFNALFGMLVKQCQLCQQQLPTYDATLIFNSPINFQVNSSNNTPPQKETNQQPGSKTIKPSYLLRFQENIEYKRIELINFTLYDVQEQLMKKVVAHKFSRMKALDQLSQYRLAETLSIVKLKNPQLLTIISKQMKPI